MRRLFPIEALGVAQRAAHQERARPDQYVFAGGALNLGTALARAPRIFARCCFRWLAPGRGCATDFAGGVGDLRLLRDRLLRISARLRGLRSGGPRLLAA
jgi:hypothetical protein